MNRVVASIVWAALATGCTTEDPFSSKEQTLSCKPETPFCDAKMPPAPAWKKGDLAPAVSADSHALLTDLGNGQMLATLSDLKQRKVVWARTLDKKEIGMFIDTSGIDVMIDIGRRPPPPPGPGGGDELAIYSLEFAVRALAVPEQASDALENY